MYQNSFGFDAQTLSLVYSSRIFWLVQNYWYFFNRHRWDRGSGVFLWPRSPHLWQFMKVKGVCLVDSGKWSCHLRNYFLSMILLISNVKNQYILFTIITYFFIYASLQRSREIVQVSRPRTTSHFWSVDCLKKTLNTQSRQLSTYQRLSW